MRYLSGIGVFFLLFSCTKHAGSHNFSFVEIETLYSDSLSIRAIEVMDGSLAFAANNGVFGSIDIQTDAIRTNIQRYDSMLPSFRAVAHTSSDFFMLSVGNPALLYKTGSRGYMELVYKEEGKGVFYDSMIFWNNLEGIAVGDGIDGCLSIIITRDGGENWKKVPCSRLPKTEQGEGAFAASNTNIAITGDKTWVATTNSRVYYSDDKGVSWELFKTPLAHDKPTQGIYSIDFYDEKLGVVVGGDYTLPDHKTANKAITMDGGIHWQLVGDGMEPGYKSCVQFVPNAGGEDIVAVGFTGISYSKDGGKTWSTLSDESFYTIRFVHENVAYAAGRNRIAKLTFN
ncbi:MAG: oxidoreductase [Bacteroidota bacterium]